VDEIAVTPREYELLQCYCQQQIVVQLRYRCVIKKKLKEFKTPQNLNRYQQHRYPNAEYKMHPKKMQSIISLW